MAFIPITATPVPNSKKGHLTPEQAAVLNSYVFIGEENTYDDYYEFNNSGILDIGNKCTVKSNTVANGKRTIVLNSGYIVICGRLIEVEQDTTVTGNNSNNYRVILRFTPKRNPEFSVSLDTDMTKSLTQQDINENPYGTYEFVLLSHSSTDNDNTYHYKNTLYLIKNLFDDIIGSGMIGNYKYAPLDGYKQINGSIENRLKRFYL